MIWYNDINDSMAYSIYNANYPGATKYMVVTSFGVLLVPDFELLYKLGWMKVGVL